MNLNQWSRNHVFMAEAGETSGAGGEGQPGGTVDAGAAPGADEAAAAAAASTAAAAASAPPAGEGATQDFIPEKFRVAKADGTPDIEASARKMAESHAHLEKRMGSGDAPPKTAADYVVAVPDQFKEQWSADNPEFKAFAADAHKQGLTQPQFDFFMNKYFEVVPAVAQGAAALTEEAAAKQLRDVWKDETDFNKNLGDAQLVATRVGEIGGIPLDEIQDAGLLVNPTFIRLMASLGPEFREDTPAKEGHHMSTGDDVNTLMASEAYKNEKHADHKAVSAKVRAYYDRKHGASPAM